MGFEEFLTSLIGEDAAAEFLANNLPDLTDVPISLDVAAENLPYMVDGSDTLLGNVGDTHVETPSYVSDLVSRAANDVGGLNSLTKLLEDPNVAKVFDRIAAEHLTNGVVEGGDGATGLEGDGGYHEPSIPRLRLPTSETGGGINTSRLGLEPNGDYWYKVTGPEAMTSDSSVMTPQGGLNKTLLDMLGIPKNMQWAASILGPLAAAGFVGHNTAKFNKKSEAVAAENNANNRAYNNYVHGLQERTNRPLYGGRGYRPFG